MIFHLDLKRLRWLGVWAPTAFVALLFLFEKALEQILPVWLVYLLVMSLLMAGAALLSRFVFATIERREEALGEMSMALSNAMPGIARLDPEGRYVAVNDGYARMLGYEPGELIGREWRLTVHPEEHQTAWAAYERMIREGKAEFEARAVRKDGAVMWKRVLMVRRVDPTGHFLGHYCFMRDITERKRAEETRQALYRASLEIQEPLSLKGRLDRLLQTASGVLSLDRLNIFLADPEGRWLQAVASLGTEEPLAAIRV
ncbi:MAG: PAS domain-containing protein, partial [Candidatus Methylomirabilales bacterium]